MRRKGHHSHYENAVEAYLIQNNIPFIATNENKKVTYNDGKIKNFDLVLPGKEMLMIDVKGRKFGYKSVPKNLYENWILKDDQDSLKIWDAVSSPSQKAFLLYVYCLPDLGTPIPNDFLGNIFYFENKVYSFHVISAENFLQHSKQRSLKPPTVSVSRKIFKTLLRPLSQVLKENKI